MTRLLPLLALTSCAALPTTTGQEGADPPHPKYGVELQAYPAGVVLAGRVEHSLGEDEVLSLRAGWNDTDRDDFGRHSNEEGGGFGGGVGYARWLEPGTRPVIPSPRPRSVPVSSCSTISPGPTRPLGPLSIPKG
jgi:hypothetical protein